MRALLSICAAIIAVVIFKSAQAQGTAQTTEEMAADITLQLASCSAYFGVVKQCAERSQSEISKDVDRRAAAAFDRAIEMMHFYGSIAKMSDAALLAQMQIANDEAIKDIDKGCQNIAVLVAKRGKFCTKMLSE